GDGLDDFLLGLPPRLRIRNPGKLALHRLRVDFGPVETNIVAPGLVEPRIDVILECGVEIVIFGLRLETYLHLQPPNPLLVSLLSALQLLEAILPLLERVLPVLGYRPLVVAEFGCL